MYAYPVYRRDSARSTRLVMAPSEEAKNNGGVESGRAKPREEVLAEASSFVRGHGGDPTDMFLILAHCKLQFGKYQGRRFRWLLENSLGYALYLVHSISRDKVHSTPLSENKQLLLQYTSGIREFTQELEKFGKKQEMQAKALEIGDQGCVMVDSKPLTEHLAQRQLFLSGPAEDDEEELVSASSPCEAQLNTALATTVELEVSAAPPPAAILVHQPPAELPNHWKSQLPPFQQEWIRQTLFRANPRTSKPELVAQLKLWWHPPQPLLMYTRPPASPDHFFCRPLFLWMPHKMWQFPLVCLRPACGKHRLTAAGLYRTVRKVLDIDGWYDLATEYLECKGCSKKYPAWSEDILGQLDMGHRSQFPALLTYRYSCDARVLRMMRERTMGNSVTQLYKKLQEQHSEAWMQRVLQYLTACEPFARSTVVRPPAFPEPPLLPALPKPKWLLAVYAKDVLGRLHEVKAKITSVFGSVLKMDSTKKVTKKLAGAAAGTAAWCTNVGNEHGQVLISVLTAGKGQALDPMAAGLVKRYREAGVAPPKIMYVDRDCCSQHGPCRVKAMFAEWDGLQVRLDIWYFMRRFAAGVTTEAHPLYGIFMARLSTCIFVWDPEDVAALRRAKEGELAAEGIGHISEEALATRITRRELALHCRRRTRGVEETTRLIGSLISLFDSASGKDTLGVPLLDHERIQQIWQEQQKHVGCIQDPEDFPLYIKTGTLKKGGVELPCYRCARDSTSLESFHLHLNRFIPGTSASDAHFQAYLVEGLMRWNDDRMEKALKGAPSIRCYGSALREAVEQLSQKVLGRGWDERYRTPGAYTGELLGIEYLYSQTGKTLTPVLQNPEEEDRLVEEVNDEDVQDEGFEEQAMEDITVPVLYEDDPCRDLETSTQASQPQAPASPAETNMSDEAQGEVIGPDGIAGWDKVQELAIYLVGLREASYLTELQVTQVIQLWTALPDGDKERVDYQPRHQPHLTSGRFKAPTRSGVTPGVESVKCCLIGNPGRPAQWPSTSRLVEAICVRLCTLHKTTTRKAGVSTPRWTKILCHYHHIRDLVLNSPRVMAETMIQLFELNQRTLIQWFQRRQKDQEMSVLSQGMAPNNVIPVAPTQLPPPKEELELLPHTSGPPQQFALLLNLGGQAPVLGPGRQPAAAATREHPVTPVPTGPATAQPMSAQLGTFILNPVTTVSLVLAAPGPSTSSAGPAPLVPAPAPAAPVSRYTKRNRSRRALEEESGVHKRKYTRKVTYNTCSQCGQPKTQEFGHSRHGSATYCARASPGKSLEEWLAEQRAAK